MFLEEGIVVRLCDLLNFHSIPGLLSVPSFTPSHGEGTGPDIGWVRMEAAKPFRAIKGQQMALCFRQACSPQLTPIPSLLTVLSNTHCIPHFCYWPHLSSWQLCGNLHLTPDVIGQYLWRQKACLLFWIVHYGDILGIFHPPQISKQRL